MATPSTLPRFDGDEPSLRPRSFDFFGAPDLEFVPQEPVGHRQRADGADSTKPLREAAGIQSAAHCSTRDPARGDASDDAHERSLFPSLHGEG